MYFLGFVYFLLDKGLGVYIMNYSFDLLRGNLTNNLKISIVLQTLFDELTSECIGSIISEVHGTLQADSLDASELI